MESPEAVYRHRLLQNQAHLALQQRWDTRLGYSKIALFVASLVIGVTLFHRANLVALMLIPVAIFVALSIAHERVLNSLRQFQRRVEFYERGLARLEYRWAGTGETGDRFLDSAHPYARDLDLFGSGSLFELLCTARTRAGEETLARWLLHPAPPDEVRERQAAVTQMKSRLEFRERLFVAGETIRLGVRPDALTAWGAREPVFRTPWLPFVLATLGSLWIAAAVYWAVEGSWLFFLAMSLINAAVSRTLHPRVSTSVATVEEAAKDLGVLSEVLQILEQETFTSPRLLSLRASLNTGSTAPSAAVKKLQRIVEWLESRRNPIALGLSPFIFYIALLAIAADRWRQKFGPSIRVWLAAVGEFEALSALAGYAWEHPADVLPEFVEQQPYFEAVGLAHPMLPESKAIANDLTLGGELHLVIVSGPNMAGKSTFLRAVGINAVLAQCGAPVRAQRLRLSPLAVGASICVLDSLQGGVSRFYAEIKRLKLLSDLAHGPIPLLFLLDELLSGTNSHDRLDGTKFMVRELVGQQAIGLVTTHDLALTAIPETMGGAAINCHFDDSIEDGKLKFDHRLKPGIVRTSNALKLMQAVGLGVENNPRI